jgi:hypothetical protein
MKVSGAGMNARPPYFKISGKIQRETIFPPADSILSRSNPYQIDLK